MLLEATVLEGVGGLYRVRPDGSAREVEATLRGRLKQASRGAGSDRVLAGDRVRVSVGDDGDATIEEVLPRTSELLRAGYRGRHPKRVAANVDRVLVVMAAAEPPFRAEVSDRFLALAEASGVTPLLVLNKVDLAGSSSGGATEEALDVYRRVGYDVVRTSAATGEGVEALRRRLSTGASVLVGPSGVGKSSLLNALDPDLELRTGAVGSRGGRGRHTTVSARLLPLPGGGWVVDTPGFSEAVLWAVDPATVGDLFPEIRDVAAECRFRSCRHVREPGCAVRGAVDEGEIDGGRYRSYRSMLEEAEAASAPG